MKKSVVLTVAAVLSMVFPLSGILGQESGNEGDDKTSDSGKKWALQFQIDKSTFLTAYNGTTLSIMRNINKTHSLRAGLSFNSNISDYLRESYLIDNDSLVFFSDGKRNDYNFQLTIQYLFKTKIHDNVSCYYGFGPNFLKSKAKQKFTDASNNPTIENMGWGIGLTGVFGMEWFFHKQISLNTEYNTSFMYQQTKTTRKRMDGDINVIETQNLYSFISSPVRFGVSVYF